MLKDSLKSLILAQYADGESNKIVLDKKKTVRASKYNTYRVRNHFAPNPRNPKLIRLKKFQKIIFCSSRTKKIPKQMRKFYGA